MAEIWTSKGFLDDATLTFTTGGVDNDNECTTWEEWRDATGEIVKRNVHVALKKGVEMRLELGEVN